MNNAAKASEAPKEKTPDSRKPQNPEALRSQEQKVTHDKVSCTVCSLAVAMINNGARMCIRSIYLSTIVMLLYDAFRAHQALITIIVR
jgi:hypothetical protein